MKKIGLDKKNFLDYFLKKAILIFLATSPIFDTVFFYSRITTFIRIIVINTFLVMTLLIKKEKSHYKNFFCLFLYYLLAFAYLVITSFFRDDFNSYIPDKFSLFEELLSIIKLCMPFTIIYILKYQDYDKEDFLKIGNMWIFLIAGSIIALNLTKLSLSSYGIGNIKYSIFQWRENLDYHLTASRGYFNYANQETVILIILLLLAIYEFLYINKKYIIHIIMVFLSMIMLGTRVATMGGLIVLAVAILSHIVISLLNKEKINRYLLFLLVLSIFWYLIIPISPYSNRIEEMESAYTREEIDKSDVIEESDVIKREDITIANSKEKKSQNDMYIDFVYDNYNPNYLPKSFFENNYPITADPEFWYLFIKNTPLKDINYRLIEKKIIERIVDIDDKPFDKYIGISNTRIQNVINLERDFLLHYYAYGLIGSTILLFFYVYSLKRATINFLKERDYFSFVLLSSIILFIFVAYLTGNIVNSMTTIIAISYIMGGLFLRVGQ